MKTRYYLAYGSNLNIQQMKRRCSTARIIGTTEIQGHELLFKGSKSGAYLTIEQNPKGCVPAAVWETTAADEAALDRYEGFPSFYYKKEMELPVKELHSGETKRLTVYVYIMHEEREIGIPSYPYLKTCLDGYRDFGLPEAYFWQALKTTRRLYDEGK